MKKRNAIVATLLIVVFAVVMIQVPILRPFLGGVLTVAFTMIFVGSFIAGMIVLCLSEPLQPLSGKNLLVKEVFSLVKTVGAVVTFVLSGLAGYAIGFIYDHVSSIDDGMIATKAILDVTLDWITLVGVCWCVALTIDLIRVYHQNGFQKVYQRCFGKHEQIINWINEKKESSAYKRIVYLIILLFFFSLIYIEYRLVQCGQEAIQSWMGMD